MRSKFLAILALASSLLLCSLQIAWADREGEGPIRVFLLAGQSNMQGQGVVNMDHPKYYNGGKGNLVNSMKAAKGTERYQHIVDKEGNFVVRDDVFVRYQTKKELLRGKLTVGYTGYGGKSHIGPEFQFGHVLGDHVDGPVLLVKTAWGGKSLYRDFRPPGAGGETGEYYELMIKEADEALANIGEDFPELKGKPYEIAGFVWFQGWNDMYDEEARANYQQNLIHLVNDVRAHFKQRNLPVVIGELGNMGPDAGDKMQAIRDAQKQAAESYGKTGNVVFVSTTDFARPKEESPNMGHGHHWFGNAESYFLIGDALGKAMTKLIGEE